MSIFKPQLNIGYKIVIAMLDPTKLPQKDSNFPDPSTGAPRKEYQLTAEVDGERGRTWYISPHLLQALMKHEVKAGVAFRFCATMGPNNRRQYLIAPYAEGAMPAAAVPPPPAPRPQAVEMPQRPAAHTKSSATMAACLIAAIDACATASAYAKTKGVAFEVDADLVQRIGATIFIEAAKSGGFANLQAEPVAAGGGGWRQ